MQPYATDDVSLGSAEEPYDPDMTHSYRLTEGRIIRYPMTRGRLIGGSTTTSSWTVVLESLLLIPYLRKPKQLNW